MTTELDYRSKVILAPMVRIGTLPTRLLDLDYGADLVYSEEMIDFKLLQCERKENDLLGTVDYVQKDGTIAFRTCPKEKDRLVFQMGTSDAERALKVAKMVENDVAAIDINMGCPKEFSLKGGMGAALLKKPEKIKEILTTLVHNLKIPVTCKIRVLQTIEETVKLAKMIESTGVRALGVHGRLTEERPRHLCRHDYIHAVAQALTIPVIANGGSGEIKCYEDIEKFRQTTGCSSVMLARAAQWNPSIFRKQGSLSNLEMVKAYLKYAIDVDNEVSNTKYCIQSILREEQATPQGQQMLCAGLLREVAAAFGMEAYYDEVNKTRQEMLNTKRRAEDADWDCFKKRKLDDESQVIELDILFNKKEHSRFPKTILYEHCVKKKLKQPEYISSFEKSNKTFYCMVVCDGQKYASSNRFMSKKWGEQAAALVCLRYHQLDEGFKEGLNGITQNNKLAANNGTETVSENSDNVTNGKVSSPKEHKSTEVVQT